MVKLIDDVIPPTEIGRIDRDIKKAVQRLFEVDEAERTKVTAGIRVLMDKRIAHLMPRKLNIMKRTLLENDV